MDGWRDVGGVAWMLGLHHLSSCIYNDTVQLSTMYALILTNMKKPDV